MQLGRAPIGASSWPVTHLRNSARAGPAATYQPSTISLERHAEVFRRVKAWPAYAPTPLLSLPAMAARVGVGRVYVKDEGQRFGLGSFKPLGGGLVVEDLALAAAAKGEAKPVIATASAGNHGIGVAWGAQQAGCRSLVYLHGGVSVGVEATIRRYGAETVRVEGDYAASVRACAADAAEHGWEVVQDTSWPGYESVPARIYQGYTVVAEEMLEQLRSEPSPSMPTHVLINAGVGGFAAGMCAHLWERLGSERPRFIAVEPTEANCLQCSAEAGALTASPHSDAGTVQTGLDCTEVAEVAWRVLATGVDDFVAVPDAVVEPAMRLLADDSPAVVAGHSAVAGIGALLAAAAQPGLQQSLGLGPDSVVAAVICEGAVDSQAFEAAVGASPEEVQARR